MVNTSGGQRPVLVRSRGAWPREHCGGLRVAPDDNAGAVTVDNIAEWPDNDVCLIKGRHE
jgi:hypothetical protein